MTTNLTSTLWIIWGVIALVTALLYAYRSSVTRNEEGQIFLDEAFAHEEAEQTAIVSKVKRLQPVLSTSLGLTVLMSLVIIGYYSYTAAKSLFN
jgi:uncharacterized BrkB/YihY/UPF0761 family membrane protein